MVGGGKAMADGGSYLHTWVLFGIYNLSVLVPHDGGQGEGYGWTVKHLRLILYHLWIQDDTRSVNPCRY